MCADLTPKELFLVAGMLTIALLVKSYINTMSRCSFKGFRCIAITHTNRQTDKLPQIFRNVSISCKAGTQQLVDNIMSFLYDPVSANEITLFAHNLNKYMFVFSYFLVISDTSK